MGNKEKFVACYCRVSADEQLEKDQSIEYQKDVLLAYVKGCQRMPVFFADSGFSGRDFQRPEFQRLLQNIETGMFEEILVTNIARLAEEPEGLNYFLGLFEEYGVFLTAVMEKDRDAMSSERRPRAILVVRGRPLKETNDETCDE